MSAPRLLSALPAFVVADVRASVAYYRDVIGFGVPEAFADADDFAIVDLAPGEGVHLVRAAAPANVTAMPSARSMGAFVRTDLADLTERHAAMAARGARVLGAPEDKPWGMRDFVVVDPDGHELRFAAASDGRLPRGGSLRVHPEIPCKDASAAIAAFRAAFGFALEGGDDDLPYFGRVGRDDVNLHWYTTRPVPAPNHTRVQAGQWQWQWDVCIEVTGIDAVAADLRARGTAIRRGPVSTDYGMRELEVDGPEGRRFCFTEDLGR